MIAECLRCSAEIEDQEYVVKCKENRAKKAEFIRNLAIKVVKWKPPDIEEAEIMEMINDIRKYLINRTDFEINQ